MKANDYSIISFTLGVLCWFVAIWCLHIQLFLTGLLLIAMAVGGYSKESE